MASEDKPLIAIIGPTASGKTTAAINLAKKIGGEIICADSRTVYKEMDIGTAKPSKKEQQGVRHHLLDIVSPDETFTVADFQRLAKEKIVEIRSRNNTPIIVGGTGLYVDSILFNYTFSVQSSEKLRTKFEKYTIEELWEYCIKNNIEIPENKHNKRYVIRSIERKGANNHKRDDIIDDCYVVGIATEKNILRQRIAQRAEGMFTDNLLLEEQHLSDNYNLSHESMSANIYPLINKVNAGALSLEKAKEQFITLDWRLAKRQITWFKRNQHIHWCDREEVTSTILAWLSARQK